MLEKVKKIGAVVITAVSTFFAVVFYVLFKEAKETRLQEEKENAEREQLEAEQKAAEEHVKLEAMVEQAERKEEAEKAYYEEKKEVEEARNTNPNTIDNVNDRLRKLHERSSARS